MKLKIKCVNVAGKKSDKEIEVECREDTSIAELKELLFFEHWLNEHTNGRFHINLEDE